MAKKPKIAAAKPGRPSSYKPEYAEQAAKLCALGATDMELADFFGVTDRTIYRWQAQFDEFCQALKAGKSEADERVERSLYHRACGYEHEAVKIFMPAGAKAPVYAPYRERIAPDTTAAIFWLKNRRSAEWRDKQEHALAEGDPLAEFLRSINGNVLKPVGDTAPALPDKAKTPDAEAIPARVLLPGGYPTEPEHGTKPVARKAPPLPAPEDKPSSK